MEFQKASGYLKNAFYQGHGRYVNQIIRMTLKFCKTGGSGREMRKFIETRLVDVARENSGCVIYVKPRIFKGPAMTAEYMNGNKHYLSFYRMSSQQIEAWIQWFLSRSGNELYKLHRPITTYRPSIQGIWTPFTFRPHDFNTAEFPLKDYGPSEGGLSATEQLIKLAKDLESRQEQKLDEQQQQEEKQSI